MIDQYDADDLPDPRRALDAIADAEPVPYWLESADIPESNPTLVRDEHCDLCIVGGGYTGLWTAVIAKERDPSRDVVLIDKGEVGGAASGRNGGFMESSLTHGVFNGIHRHADEIDLLEELGLQNLNDIERAIERYDIQCDYERNGVIDVATTSHPPSYIDELRDEHDLLRSLGQSVTWLEQDAMRAEVDSPTYVGGLFRTNRAGHRRSRPSWRGSSSASPKNSGCASTNTPRRPSIDKDGAGMLVTTPLGNVRCAKVVLGTNADRPLLKRLRQYMIPVYDYCLVTEPLTDDATGSRRLGEPPGPVRHHQPVPLLPAHAGQPDPVGRLRRHLLLGLQGVAGPGEPAGDVGEAVVALLPDLPAARGRQVLPRVGWRHRHEHPLLGVLRDGDVRPGRLRRSATPASAWPPPGSPAP